MSALTCSCCGSPAGDPKPATFRGATRVVCKNCLGFFASWYLEIIKGPLPSAAGEGRAMMDFIFGFTLCFAIGIAAGIALLPGMLKGSREGGYNDGFDAGVSNARRALAAKAEALGHVDDNFDDEAVRRELGARGRA